MEHFDVIVIGTGGVGSAAAMHLARCGARVLGLDRFPPGHDRGSSHGQTRVIRQAYFEHPDYVPLLKRAYELWEGLEQVHGTSLFARVGVLQVGEPNGAVIQGVNSAARLHGLHIDNLDPAQMRDRFPGFQIDGNQSAVFEANAGYLRVEPCVIEHCRTATEAGADLRSGIEVRGWKAEAVGVIVETDKAAFSAQRLVITAGAWAAQLLTDLNCPLGVLRKQLYWFTPASNAYRQESGSPCFLYDLPDGCFYGFPQIDDRGVKVARHSGGEAIADPLQLDRVLNEAECADVSRFVSRWMPGLTTRLLEHATCMYTMSPDENFIIDRHPDYPQVSFAAGLSGHGFKFTSVLGEILCQLALEDNAALPIDFLSVKRFQTR